MKPLRPVWAAFCLFCAASFAQGQHAASFLLLGDRHFDRGEDHDLAWLKAKADDYRQSTTEYQVYTRKNWAPLTELLLKQAASLQPPVRAIIQLGDLQEGLAGTPEKARQMARDAIEALRADAFPVPWLLVKGNHDVTGPGAAKAYQDVIVPFLRQELKQDVAHAYYACRFGDVEFICLDYYEKGGAGFLPFLEKQLAGSTARYKFVALHEPVIPVTARCWHVLRRPEDSQAREKLLNLLARHRVIVLCGHLHKYAVVRRATAAGPVVQVMINSVIVDPARPRPNWSTNQYGPELVEREPQFSPATRQQRMQILAEESKYVTDFRLADLPGYGVLVVDASAGRVLIRAYGGASDQPYEETDLTRLLQPDPGASVTASRPGT